MRLLVSVASAEEVFAAVTGGADIIDAKDPAAGALGAVSTSGFRDIVDRVAGRTPVSAALGDAVDEAGVEHIAREFAASGASFVKVGFATIEDAARTEALIAAAARGAGRTDVVAVAYADTVPATCLARTWRQTVEAAARAGARGILLDTADKGGPSLPALLSADALQALVQRAHQHGLLAAVAGKLTAADLAFVRHTGADIAGVRGAACDGGRAGRVSAQRVRALIAGLKPCATTVH